MKRFLLNFAIGWYSAWRLAVMPIALMGQIMLVLFDSLEDEIRHLRERVRHE